MLARLFREKSVTTLVGLVLLSSSHLTRSIASYDCVDSSILLRIVAYFSNGITHRDALSAGCGGDQLAHRAPVRCGRQGCALHSMVGEVASKIGEGDLGTHDHAEVGAIDGHVSPACALRRFGCLRGRGEASVGAVAVEN